MKCGKEYYSLSTKYLKTVSNSPVLHYRESSLDVGSEEKKSKESR